MSAPVAAAAPQADHAIVVFGCPARADGSPTPALERRLQHALVLAADDPQALLIVSGGAVIGPCEADAMRAWLVRRGVDPARVVPEPLARDTLENARYSAALLQHIGARQVSLVTERYHAPRSAALMRGVLRRRGALTAVRVCAAPDSLDGAGRLREAMRERVKRLTDTLRLWMPLGA